MQEEACERGYGPVPVAPQALLPGITLRAGILDVLPPLSKDLLGCKLGLHDNHWVPACHSFNRAIHKKAKGTETEEEY